MLESSLMYVVLRTLPESIILMLASFILLDLKLNVSKILKNGLVLGVFITLIRKLPITFGVHSILSMVVLGIMLFKISDEKFMNVIIVPCDVWIALALSEGIYYLLATGILKISPDILTNYGTIEGALSTLPSLAILILIVMIIKSVKRKMLKSF